MEVCPVSFLHCKHIKLAANCYVLIGELIAKAVWEILVLLDISMQKIFCICKTVASHKNMGSVFIRLECGGFPYKKYPTYLIQSCIILLYNEVFPSKTLHKI